MSWIAQYKDPCDDTWKEKEFDTEHEANVYIRAYEIGLVFHS